MTTDVELAHRQALEQAGRVLCTVRCGVDGCRRRVAVVRDTPVGPLWVGAVERVDLDGAPTGRAGRVPSFDQPVVLLLDYRPPADDGLSARTLAAFMSPPAAACRRHGQLLVDLDAVRGSVVRRTREHLLRTAT